MTTPTPRDRLIRTGLSAAFTDLVLNQHAHELAEQIRAERDEANIPGSPVSPAAVRGMTRAADLIDPESQP